MKLQELDSTGVPELINIPLNIHHLIHSLKGLKGDSGLELENKWVKTDAKSSYNLPDGNFTLAKCQFRGLYHLSGGIYLALSVYAYDSIYSMI